MNNGGKVLVVGTGVALAGLGVWALTRKKAGASGTPTITVVPSSPTAGVLFDIDFSGWLPNSTLQVTVSNLTTGAQPQTVAVTVDSNGNGTLPSMAQNAATYRVDATGASGQLATLTFTVAAAPPPPPPAGKASLYGRIYDSATSQGIAGAVIVLTAADGSTANATSDSTGAYLFSNLNANITVSWGVAAVNYVSASGTISLLEGNNQKDVALVAIPPPANVITFGTLTGQRMQAYDQNGYYLTFFTCNLSCGVMNQGPVTTRTIQAWRQYPGDIAYNVKTVSLDIPADGAATFSYVGNPVGAGSILLQINTADIWLVDAGSGSISNKIEI